MNLSTESRLRFSLQAFKAGLEAAERVSILPFETFAEEVIEEEASAFRDQLQLDGAPAGTRMPAGSIGTMTLFYLMGVAFKQGCEWASGGRQVDFEAKAQPNDHG